MTATASVPRAGFRCHWFSWLPLMNSVFIWREDTLELAAMALPDDELRRRLMVVPEVERVRLAVALVASDLEAYAFVLAAWPERLPVELSSLLSYTLERLHGMLAGIQEQA